MQKNEGAIQIRSDAVRKHLARIPLDESGQDSLYSAQMTDKTYARLLELGITLAQAGYKVILDAKYDRHTPRQQAISRSQTNNIPLKIVHCTAPLSVLRDRLKQRHNDVSDATADLIASQQQNAEVFTTEEQAYVTTVDTSQSNLLPQFCSAKCFAKFSGAKTAVYCCANSGVANSNNTEFSSQNSITSK